MDIPNHPEDREKKEKGLIAGQRDRSFAEVIPESQTYLAKLRARVARLRTPRGKQIAPSKGGGMASKGKKDHLPESFRPFFWSYRFEDLDPQKHKKTVIVQLVNYGTLAALALARPSVRRRRDSASPPVDSRDRDQPKDPLARNAPLFHTSLEAWIPRRSVKRNLHLLPASPRAKIASIFLPARRNSREISFL